MRPFLSSSWFSRAIAFAPPLRSMAFLWHLAKGLVSGPGSQPIHFSNSNIQTLPLDQPVEEEAHDAISKGRYYPVHIGDVIESKYQIVGKLGYGLGSTVWLANDLR